jgi:N-carbamoylputrescine amidase
VPVIASNRIGLEKGTSCDVTFYGSSFITDHTGAKLEECNRDTQGVISAELDLDHLSHERTAWGLFRDRRPDLYGNLLNLGGA